MERKTLYQISKQSGVAWRVLQRFLAGERAKLRTGTVDRLCDYLGLELSRKPKRRG